MKRITIGCGNQYDRDGKMITSYDTRAARSQIVEKALDLFGGVTFLNTYGGWRDGSGQTVIEQGWSIVAYADADTHAQQFAMFVRDALRQQAVYLTVEEIDAKLV